MRAFDVVDMRNADPNDALAYMNRVGIVDVALSRWLRLRPETHPIVALMSAIRMVAWSEVEPLLDRVDNDMFDRLSVLHDVIVHGRPGNAHLQRAILHRLLAPLLAHVDVNGLFALAVQSQNAMAARELVVNMHNNITAVMLRSCMAMADPQLTCALLVRDDVDPLTVLDADEIWLICRNPCICDVLRANHFVSAAVKAERVWFTYGKMAMQCTRNKKHHMYASLFKIYWPLGSEY